MDTIIRNGESIPLGSHCMLDITRNNVSILTYKDLEHYNHLDELLYPFGAVIILFQVEVDFGHWVSLTLDNGVLTYFDSYGFQMDTELQFATYNLRQHNGVPTPHLSVLVEKSGYPLVQNKIEFQKKLKDVNTCGRYAALWVRLRHLGLKSFQKLLEDNKHYNPDFWVTALTLLCSDI
jgi:hypothetical protein